MIQRLTDDDSFTWEVNFTDTLYKMIRDTQLIVGLGIGIPEEGKFVVDNYDMLMTAKVKMQVRFSNKFIFLFVFYTVNIFTYKKKLN